MPTFVTVSQVEQTTNQGDQGSTTVDTSDLGSSTAVAEATSSAATLQELVSANTGSFSASDINISGTITGKLEYLIDFGQNTFDFKATQLLGGNFDGDSISVSNNGATLPSDSRTALTIGNGGDFTATRSQGCTNCSLKVEFPSTSSFNATVRDGPIDDAGSISGSTGETQLTVSE